MIEGLSATPYQPDTLDELTEARVFPSPLPPAFYNDLLAAYEAEATVKVSHITYESDGLTITGLMAHPTVLIPNHHPILIYNRGGSREYGRLSLLSVMRSMLPFAKAGYIVLASDYRGNHGSEGREEFGGKDVDDVLKLLAIGQAQPAWDRRNSFMLGHSRGGMMTYLAIKRGAKLNAAISIAGIADVIEMSQDERLRTHVLEALVPGNDREEAYRERSAVEWPEKLDVPLLLLHGNSDKDVPASHSIRLTDGLSAHHKPHKLHLYEGGNHALIRFWDDVVEKIFTWLKEHSA